MTQFGGLGTGFSSNAIYNGEAMEELGIYDGQPLNEAISKLIAGYRKVVTVEKKLERSELLASNKGTDAITHEGAADIIGDSLSVEAAKMTSAKISYEVEESGDSTKLSYDLSSVEADIPAGYKILRKKVVVTGEKLAGKTQIINTDKLSGSIPIPYVRYPLSIQATVTVVGEKGEIELSKNITVQSTDKSAKTKPLDVIDRTNRAKAEYSLKDVLDSYSARLSGIENRL
jgi:hypothetical protein